MTTSNRSRRGLGSAARLAPILGIGFIGLLGLAGCSEDMKQSSTTQPAQSETGGGDGSLGGGTSTEGQTTAPATTRKLVIKMTIGLEVADTSLAVDKVVALAEAHGGMLYDSAVDLSDERYANGDLVFKMPPEEVDGFVQGLSPGIGRRTGLQGTTADVTDQLTDLDSQIRNARASVERVRELMDKATTLTDVVTLEGELTTRETRLEQLLAQQSNLNDEVAMATITVHLTTASALADSGEKTTIGKAFGDGWHAFVEVLRGLVLFVGYTLPFLVLGAIALVIVLRVKRGSSSS